MSPQEKRDTVSKAYPGDKWIQKVEKMSDAQVHVIYTRLVNLGKLKG